MTPRTAESFSQTSSGSAMQLPAVIRPICQFCKEGETQVDLFPFGKALACCNCKQDVEAEIAVENQEVCWLYRLHPRKRRVGV